MKKPDPTPCTLFMLLMSAILLVSGYNKGEKKMKRQDAISVLGKVSKVK